MWLCLRDGFLSIVAKDCADNELLVRARRAGDIEKVFPAAMVTKSTTTDYMFRAIVSRDAVKQAMTAEVEKIDYPNFKDAVEDSSLHTAYVGVWCAMAGLQHPPPYIPTKARSGLASKSTP